MKHIRTNYNSRMWNMCASKYGYEGKKSAKNAIKRRRRTLRARGMSVTAENLRAYLCPICNKYHLTHKPKLDN